MRSEITVRRLRQNERDSALLLVWNVFLQFEAPDYTVEGVEEFRKSINSETYLSQLRFYGAFCEARLVGVIATRNEGTHIALFFVDAGYQRRGVGKRLFREVCKRCSGRTITVNSSPYAAAVYRRLGFTDTDGELEVNGLRFTPMKAEIHRCE